MTEGDGRPPLEAAGVYLGSGFIALWAVLTLRRQSTLVFLVAFNVLLAGIGRLVSISQVGLRELAAVWLGYLVPELLVPSSWQPRSSSQISERKLRRNLLLVRCSHRSH